MDEGLLSLDLPIAGMSCGACVQRLREALEALPGVEGAEVAVGSVRLRYYPEALSGDAIRARIEAVGYRIAAPAPASRNPILRFLERMGEANERALAGKRLDCCKLSDGKPN
jgi:Cd2+/Zn2+-exporting ATPase